MLWGQSQDQFHLAAGRIAQYSVLILNTTIQLSLALTMFSKASSMGDVKHRLVFKDRQFSQAVQY